MCISVITFSIIEGYLNIFLFQECLEAGDVICEGCVLLLHLAYACRHYSIEWKIAHAGCSDSIDSSKFFTACSMTNITQVIADSLGFIQMSRSAAQWMLHKLLWISFRSFTLSHEVYIKCHMLKVWSKCVCLWLREAATTAVCSYMYNVSDHGMWIKL